MKPTSRDASFFLYSLFLFLLMAPSIRALIGYVLDLNHTNASHAALIPIISGSLIFLNRKEIFRKIQYSILPGTMLMILGLGLFAAGKIWGPFLQEGDYLALMTFSLVVLWLGGFWLFYGSAAVKTAFFPLLLLVFCCPLPGPVLDGTIGFLRRGSADMAFVLLKLTGTPIYRQGFVFVMPDLMIEVAPECSGIRSALSLFICSLLAGYLLLRSSWRWGALLLATIPIVIFKNGLRIGVLSFLAVHYDKSILSSRLHQEGGIPFFVIGLFLIYPVLALLLKQERKGTAPPPIPQEAHQ